MSTRRQAEKPSNIINLEVARNPKDGGLCVSFDMLELPEKVIVNTFIPPFITGAYERKKVYTEGVNAVRIVRASGGVGSCKCSACGWSIDPYDLFCRRCGKEYAGTIYERAGAEDERR